MMDPEESLYYELAMDNQKLEMQRWYYELGKALVEEVARENECITVYVETAHKILEDYEESKGYELLKIIHEQAQNNPDMTRDLWGDKLLEDIKCYVEQWPS